MQISYLFLWFLCLDGFYQMYGFYQLVGAAPATLEGKRINAAECGPVKIIMIANIHSSNNRPGPKLRGFFWSE